MKPLETQSKYLKQKPTYSYSRQYTRTGNPMQRYEVFEVDPVFGGDKGRIAIVYNGDTAKQITEFLNSLPFGTKKRIDTITWYERYKPEYLKECAERQSTENVKQGNVHE